MAIPIFPYAESMFNPQLNNLWIVDFSKVGVLQVPAKQNLQLLARSSSIPERTIDTFSDGFINQQTNYAGFMAQAGKTWEVTFLDIYDPQDIRKIFMQWQKVIFNTDNFTQGYKKAYAFDIDITLLNYERLPYRKFVLYRAFPTTISNTDLTYPESGGSPGKIQISVTFTYDYFDEIPLT